MAHDVFVSYSAQDKAIADALVAALEHGKIRCWVAPRDILPSMDWSTSIVAAIESCSIFILVFSNGSNESKHVKREVELAIETEKYILPFRIENVALSAHMRYFIKTQHWLDALTPPLESHLKHLIEVVDTIISTTLQQQTKNDSKDLASTTIEEVAASTNSNRTQAGEIIISNSIIGLESMLIKGNIFSMGDVFGDSTYKEKPIHQVTIFDFYLSRTEITNAQYARFLEEYGSEIIKNGEYAGQQMIFQSPGLEGSGRYWEAVLGYENHPVVNVTWYGANEFSRYYNLRLPTEAEWEFAARSGGKNEKWAGTNSLSNAKDFAWFKNNSDNTTHKVGMKKPNSIGLFDMSGNAWEWCQDWYSTYGSSAVRNPQGPAIGSSRIARGGSYLDDGKEALTVVRNHHSPNEKSLKVGFRIAQSFLT